MIKEYIADLKAEFAGYNPEKFKRDLFSGITVTAVALPLALAFGVMCGASAASGLITAIIAGIVIGALSGGSLQISGPTGAMSAILIMLFQRFGLQGVLVAGFLSGILLIAAGLLKLGKIVSFIPSPVITGFTSGIAIIIAFGQIDNLLGNPAGAAEGTVQKIVDYFRYGAQVNTAALLVGLLAVAIMLLWPKKWGRALPSPLAALIVCLAVSAVWKPDIKLIGAIPRTLLLADRLRLSSIDFSAIGPLVAPAFSIAALCMIESLLCGEVGAKMTNGKFSANRELVSQGVGNMILPFFGGIPATAAIARTSVAIKSDGVTRLVSIIHSIGLLLSMFLLWPVMAAIPLSALAGILMVTAWRMNDWESIRFIFKRKYKSAIFKFLLTLIATVLLDLTQAIIIGMAAAAILFVGKLSNMDISVSDVDQKRLHVKVEREDLPFDHIRVVYFSGALFFGTVQQLKNQLLSIQGFKVIILSMRGVPLIDTSGILALEELYFQLKQKGCTLMLCSLQPKALAMVKRSALYEQIGEDNVFWSADQAIVAAQKLN